MYVLFDLKLKNFSKIYRLLLGKIRGECPWQRWSGNITSKEEESGKTRAFEAASLKKKGYKMKLCFPVKADSGLESIVFNHFGSSPLFILFDTETDTTSVINNQDLGHVHGMCSPFKALNGEIADAVIVGGIGAGAIRKLNAMGIKVYRAIEDTIRKNIDLFGSNSLAELSVADACMHHGGCDH